MGIGDWGLGIGPLESHAPLAYFFFRALLGHCYSNISSPHAGHAALHGLCHGSAYSHNGYD